MLRATGRHPYRPAHIHFLVRASGHLPVTTHAFVAGSPYLAMELASWGSLDRVKLPLRWEDLLRLLLALLDALAHAHARGVVHRDLKPGNVLVEEPDQADGSGRAGEPKILDFGVARLTDADLMVTTVQTNSGQIIGRSYIPGGTADRAFVLR